jgi:hypothetical protein
MKLIKKKGDRESVMFDKERSYKYHKPRSIIESTQKAKEFFEKYPLTLEMLKKLREEGKVPINAGQQH